jgi:hypothetical protein
MEQRKRGFMDRPVRLRWLAYVALVLIIAALVVLGIQAWSVRTVKLQAQAGAASQIKLKGEAVARTIAVTARQDILNGEYGRLQEYFADLVTQPDMLYLIVMTTDGTAVVHTDTKFRSRKLEDEVAKRAVAADDMLVQVLKATKTYDIAVPVMSFTRKAAVVRVGVSYASAEDMFR